MTPPRRKVEHSPLPWSIDAMGYLRADDGTNVLEHQENALFVEKAVNLFPRLVEALEAVLEGVEINKEFEDHVRQLLSEASYGDKVTAEEKKGNRMPFTDDDLNTLKEDLASLPAGVIRIPVVATKALLYRLEAAEYVAENCVCKGKGHDIVRAAWRKAKREGK